MDADWIATERTRMRRFEKADAEAAFRWLSDLEVMRFIPGGSDASLEDTQRRIERYREHEARFGFSKRLILHRETGQPIGDCGLFHLPDGKRVELGFRLAQSCWGAGYAAEAGRAWVAWFAMHFPGEALFADVHPEHVRSQRVLSKLGFHRSHPEPIQGMPMLSIAGHAIRPGSYSEGSRVSYLDGRERLRYKNIIYYPARITPLPAFLHMK